MTSEAYLHWLNNFAPGVDRFRVLQDIYTPNTMSFNGEAITPGLKYAAAYFWTNLPEGFSPCRLLLVPAEDPVAVTAE